MDEQQKMKEYLLPKKIVLIAGFILLAAAAALLAFGIYRGTRDFKSQAMPFEDFSHKGDYVYIDVAGISDWVYKYDDDVYYAAEDPEGYFYILRMSKYKASAMSEQEKYWERPDDSTPMPEPVRVYGIAEDIENDLKDAFAQVFDITGSDVDYYFGYLYLDTTSDPGTDTMWMCITGALFSFLFSLVCLAVCLPAYSALKKSVKELDARGETERAASAFAFSGEEMLNGAMKTGGDYLFAKNLGLVLRFDDILWAHIRTINGTLHTLVLYTRRINGVNIGSVKGNEGIEQVAEAIDMIHTRNPSMLVGFTAENRKLYQQLRGGAV